ncbi:MAG TPA: DNA repair exonuclease [bacterium]|nr:DNA repair exonuclease [bacterium]
MKILHTADIHLKKYEDERWQTLEKLIETGKKEKIDCFIISGDLFDQGADAERLRPRIREIFTDNGFKIILIPGNHDVDSFQEGSYFGEDIIIIKDFLDPYIYGDVVFWGMPFEPVYGNEILNRLYTMEKNLDKEKHNILLFHGELTDGFFSRKDFGEEGENRYMPIKLDYFQDMEFEYILAGHFHSKFNIWSIPKKGFFIYPGSPISITKKETGQRKVNIFEVGAPPKEYLINSPFYEEINIEFNPFSTFKPIDLVKEKFVDLNPAAKVILNIKGYLDSEKVGLSESDIARQINEFVGGRCVEKHVEFKDTHQFLEDDLFKTFLLKLEERNFDEEKKKQMVELALSAFIEAKK